MTTYLTPTTAIVAHSPQNGHIKWLKEPVYIRATHPDEVQVRILASGICHTDIAMSLLPPSAPGFSPYPKVLGHEGAGIVEKVGSSITHVREGDKVLLSFDFCGKREECKGCKDEAPGYCADFHTKNLFSVPDVYRRDENGKEEGEGVAGLFFGQSSFAQVAVCKGTSVLNVEGLVRDEEELKLFAPLGCGYQTGAGAVDELAKVGERDSIAVFGLGGVGMAAIMAAKVRGAKTIIGVDRIPSRLSLAQELGATHTINTSSLPSTADSSSPNPLTTALKALSPSGLSYIFDTTGSKPLLSSALPSLSRQGQLILIGIVDGTLDIDIGFMLNYGTSIRGCIEGNALPSRFVPRMIEWYREGKFPIEKLTRMYGVEEWEVAVRDMHSGETVKAVLVW